MLANASAEHTVYDTDDGKCFSLSCEGSQDWAKDRKNRPMQQEDEYRLHMELNRCLKKDTAAAGADPDLFESQTTRTVSSRGWSENSLSYRILFFFASASCIVCTSWRIESFNMGWSLLRNVINIRCL